jgi:two-component system alkaline phosphatase synthesis response regulator PhoP
MHPSGGSAMPKKIMIADDERNIVTAIEFLLQRSGYEVRVANNGEDALKQLERFVPDLLLLDIMMPAMNGYEVCQTIRQSAHLRHVKIIMLTARGRDADLAKGLALGADAYITKPFANADLLAKVKELLGGSP